MKRQLDEELNGLKERILQMGSLAETMIHLSVKDFLERREDPPREVFEREDQVNQLQIEVDETAVRILALHQPEATDLRTIMASVKINSELERVADQAVNIAQTSYYHLAKETPLSTLVEIPRMAEIAKGMIKESLDAYARRDVALAQSVLARDEEEDTLKATVLNEVIRLIKSKPQFAQQLVDLILIAKNLEKIGDHATNIAEDVIFMVLGKDIRHPHSQPTP